MHSASYRTRSRTHRVFAGIPVIPSIGNFDAVPLDRSVVPVRSLARLVRGAAASSAAAGL
jgi:hypothetical protein